MNDVNPISCSLCKSSDILLVYEGEMRHSGIGSKKVNHHSIYRCSSCFVEFIFPLPKEVTLDYEGEYWKKKGMHSHHDLIKIHNKALFEAKLWFAKLNLNVISDKVVLDFGCGSGAFLDIAKGIASETIGIEQDPKLAAYASSKGHKIFSSLEDFIKYNIKIDCIVSFDVLEHLTEPIQVLKSIKKVLKCDSTLFLGVPNQNDFIKDLVPSYLPHFYHVEHLWYYSQNSLDYILTKCGYNIHSFGFLHKYNFMNFVEWAKTGVASGIPISKYVDNDLDLRFNGWLENRGSASHIFAFANLDNEAI